MRSAESAYRILKTAGKLKPERGEGGLKLQSISPIVREMAEIRPFAPVKLVCGIITGREARAAEAERRLGERFGPVEARGPRYPFAGTAYYQEEMGPGLSRGFISFRDLIAPERLPDIKIETNALEEDLRKHFATPGRAVNLDPGILTAAALFMATTKEFSHRPPLRNGIYAHLELLFVRNGVKRLEWTYPDLRTEDHIPFFLDVRKTYLETLKPPR